MGGWALRYTRRDSRHGKFGTVLTQLRFIKPSPFFFSLPYRCQAFFPPRPRYINGSCVLIPNQYR